MIAVVAMCMSAAIVCDGAAMRLERNDAPCRIMLHRASYISADATVNVLCYFLALMTACAPASRASGTRNGEQET